MTIYINGAASGTSTTSADQAPDGTVDSMTLGSRAGSGKFDGAFQDFDMWAAEFTAAQVAGLYASGVGSSGLNQMRATHKSHSKLINTTIARDEIAGFTWSLNNGPTSETHHSMIYPAHAGNTAGGGGAAATGDANHLTLLGVG